MQQPAAPLVYPSQTILAADSHCTHRVIEDPEWSLATVPHLTELCIQHIVHNFEKNPIFDRLLPEHQKKVLDRLSTGLPLSVTANLISDEDYWKRCCTERWQVCDISNYGDSWKRMFFERHLENILKCFIPNTTDPNQVLDLIPICKDYVQKLEVDQFLPPLKVDQKEEEEDLADAESDFEVFKLTRSKVDDEKTRLLVRNLLDHPCLVELNLSHNLIRDKGARAVGKLINRSKLEILDLCNNQIRHVGAQALAQALAGNSTLTSLNLRLNCVEDEGGEAIGRALLTNTTLKSIHLGSNNLSEPTAMLFSQVLAQNTTLTSINFSCNHLGLDGGKQLLDGLADNKVLTEFDLRLAEVGQETEYLIHQIVWANRDAARLGSLQQPSATLL